MTIDISKDLKEKIIAFCDDELNYHINESGCADEYQDEIEAQIELLRLLGKKAMANKYEKQFNEYMADFEDDDDYDDDDYVPYRPTKIDPNETYMVDILDIDKFYDLDFEDEFDRNPHYEPGTWFYVEGKDLAKLDAAKIRYEFV